MPTLIKWHEGQAELAEDPFTAVADDELIPRGDVIISLTRFQAEGDRLLSECRKVGVRVESDEAVEALAFPKYRDGRAYTGARLLRERFAYAGQIRAVGDVLREQALWMIRCGFDAFEPADGSTAADWAHVAARYRHVYQRASDHRAPAFQERQG